MPVAASVGLLAGWLVSGTVYLGQIVPVWVSVLIWIGGGAGLAYYLWRRMTSPYADWTDDRLVGTGLGRWIVMVASILAVLTLVRVIDGTFDGADLGPSLWGIDPL